MMIITKFPIYGFQTIQFGVKSAIKTGNPEPIIAIQACCQTVNDLDSTSCAQTVQSEAFNRVFSSVTRTPELYRRPSRRRRSLLDKY